MRALCPRPDLFFGIKFWLPAALGFSADFKGDLKGGTK
jgi:hypothetical protein